MATYDSRIDLNLGQVPRDIKETSVYQELLDIHNALEKLADTLSASFDFQGFLSKPIGEPLVVLMFGDSNGVGTSSVGTNMEKNPNVFTWGKGGLLANPVGWYVVDPNGPQAEDYPDAAGFVGMLQESRGNIGWQCADTLQRLTQRKVYYISVVLNGTGIADFSPGGIAYNNMITALAAAQASPEINGAKVDISICEVGALDIAMTPAQYTTAFTTLYDDGVTQGWNEDRFTQWLLVEGTDFFLTTSVLNERAAADRYHEYVRTISGAFLTTVPGDPFGPIHYQGFELNKLGYMCALQACLGPNT